MGALAQRALGPETRHADFEGGLVMAFLPTGGSNSTATAAKHFTSSTTFYSFIHPVHKYLLSNYYGPDTALGTGDSAANEPERTPCCTEFIFSLGRVTKYKSKLVSEEGDKCCGGK